MPLTIVHAARGEGKTTFLCAYAARTAAAGRSIGGIASVAVCEGGQRIGYDLFDLRLGTRRNLARIVSPEDKHPTVGVYRFDDQAVRAGNEAIQMAVTDRLDMIAIDEVGPLELRGEGWAPALEFALQRLGSRQELAVVVRSSLADELPERFGSPLWSSARWVSRPWPD
jgi:nucleoside-triphosphatase THEP1